MAEEKVLDVLSQDFKSKLFPPERELIPGLSDLYELELAFYENEILNDKELLLNGAYFARVRGEFTRHFQMCTGKPLKLPNYSSSRLKSFFEKNIFRTGYATHGLFPYRGKFHPQMIKGLINTMGIKSGEKVLDPMMGSGTLPLEAKLMGIHSIGIDASPFCRFMTQTKVDALTMSLMRAKRTLNNYKEVFVYFANRVGKSKVGSKEQIHKTVKGYMNVMDSASEYVKTTNREHLTKKDRDTSDTYNFLLLAYLDSVGYSERSKKKSPVEQFRSILERYLFVAEKIQVVLRAVEPELGKTEILEGDSRSLPLDDESIDGIIFSPPYSFAVDYLANDSSHLNFLGVRIEELKSRMIGLRGRSLSEKFELYKEDMNQVLAECARVLRKNKFCAIIVGTNSNQLSKVLGVSPEDVPGLQKIIVDMAENHGFKLAKEISRPITGISNTMRKEYILIMEKE